MTFALVLLRVVYVIDRRRRSAKLGRLNEVNLVLSSRERIAARFRPVIVRRRRSRRAELFNHRALYLEAVKDSRTRLIAFSRRAASRRSQAGQSAGAASHGSVRRPQTLHAAVRRGRRARARVHNDASEL